jgi:hypothetical protein
VCELRVDYVVVDKILSNGMHLECGAELSESVNRRIKVEVSSKTLYHRISYRSSENYWIKPILGMKCSRTPNL